MPAEENILVDYEKVFADAIAGLKAEGRYCIFADLERQGAQAGEGAGAYSPVFHRRTWPLLISGKSPDL